MSDQGINTASLNKTKTIIQPEAGADKNVVSSSIFRSINALALQTINLSIIIHFNKRMDFSSAFSRQPSL